MAAEAKAAAEESRARDAQERAATLEHQTEALKAQLAKEKARADSLQTLAQALTGGLAVHERVEASLAREAAGDKAVAATAAERIKQLEAAVEAQRVHAADLREALLLQERETQLAQRVLDRTSQALEIANASKKVVLHQWQQALDSMSRRDQVLQGVQEKASELKAALGVQAAVAGSLATENQALTKDLSLVQGSVAQMRARLARVDKEMAALVAERASLVGTDGVLQREASRAEQLKETAEQQAARAGRERDRALAEAEALRSEIREVKEKAEAEVLSAKAEARNAMRATVRDVSQAEGKLTEQQQELARVDQARAALAVQQSITASQFRNLEAEHALTVKAHGALLQRYDALRADTDDLAAQLARKSHDVDSMRARAEALEGKARTEDLPVVQKLTAEVRAKEAELALQAGEIARLRREWHRTQSDLVAAETRLEHAREELAQRDAKQAVRDATRAKLEGDLGGRQRELEEALVEVDTLRVQLTKYNWEIASLRQQNAVLTGDRDGLRVEVRSQRDTYEELLRGLQAEGTRARREISRLAKLVAEHGARDEGRADQREESKRREGELRARVLEAETNAARLATENARQAKQISKLARTVETLSSQRMRSLDSAGAFSSPGGSERSGPASQALPPQVALAASKLENENAVIRQKYAELTARLLTLDNEMARVSQENKRLAREVARVRKHQAQDANPNDSPRLQSLGDRIKRLDNLLADNNNIYNSTGSPLTPHSPKQ